MHTVSTFTNQLEAAHAVSLLESEGFDAVLLDEGSFLNGYGLMRLQVPEQQALAAVEFLEEFREAKPEYIGDAFNDQPAET